MSDPDALIRRIERFLPTVVFFTLAWLMFIDVIFAGAKYGQVVASSAGGDLMSQFLAWRHFGFGELASGNLALWNPHIYGGTPYFGFFQSALLYPPNWTHFFLPLERAINVQLALHVFLAGQFMYWWVRGRGMSAAAGTLAGVMFMFAGPYFLHIYAGHLPHLGLMVWPPLLFLALDRLGDKFSLGAVLLGTFALSMILLAGHPQYVYFLGLLTGIYVLLNLITATHRASLMAGSGIIVAGALLLCAVQLLTGIEAVNESVRQAVDYRRFARTFSLPPENLLTLIAPSFFGLLPMGAGDSGKIAYFGRAYLWEMQLFVTLSGLVFAVLGAIVGGKSRRFATTMVVISLILAIGAHTPLHRLMYDLLPGFKSFRGASKFSFFAAVYLPMLAAIGFDYVLSRRNVPNLLWIGTACVAGVTAIVSLVIAVSGSGGLDGSWHTFIRWIAESAADFGELYYDQKLLLDRTFTASTASAASTAMVSATLVLLVITGILIATKFRFRAIYLLIALAAVEGFVFARAVRPTTTVPTSFLPAQWKDVLKRIDPQSRVYMTDSMLQNAGMIEGYQNLWGYDPGVLRRYAELMAASQGQDRNAVDQYVRIMRPQESIFRMLRCAAIFVGGEKPQLVPINNPLPLASLVSNAIVVNEPDTQKRRDRILDTMLDPAFKPDSVVLLESAPKIAPVGGSYGTCETKVIDSDTIEVLAKTSGPTLLLLTNNFASGWRVSSIGPSKQSDYTIQSANWALMAIALEGGQHHLRIEYRPGGFVIGRVISVVSLIGFLALVGYDLNRRIRGRRATVH